MSWNQGSFTQSAPKVVLAQSGPERKLACRKGEARAIRKPAQRNAPVSKSRDVWINASDRMLDHSRYAYLPARAGERDRWRFRVIGGEGHEVWRRLAERPGFPGAKQHAMPREHPELALQQKVSFIAATNLLSLFLVIAEQFLPCLGATLADIPKGLRDTAESFGDPLEAIDGLITF